MERDKIIQMAEKSKIDEREKQIASVGAQIAGVVQMVFILLIMVLRYIKGNLFSQDLLLLIAVQMATMSLYQYIKLKKTAFLITFIIVLIAVPLVLYNVLVEYGYI